MNPLEIAAQRLTERKLAGLGLGPEDDGPGVVDAGILARPLLLGTGIDPEDVAAGAQSASTVLLNLGVGTHTLPALIQSAWLEGFLLGAYLPAENRP